MSSSAILYPSGREVGTSGSALRRVAKKPDMGSAQSTKGRASQVASREFSTR